MRIPREISYGVNIWCDALPNIELLASQVLEFEVSGSFPRPYVTALKKEEGELSMFSCTHP